MLLHLVTLRIVIALQLQGRHRHKFNVHVPVNVPLLHNSICIIFNVRIICQRISNSLREFFTLQIPKIKELIIWAQKIT
jgi:hypothetical protein